jgi:hypothetical protein
MDTITLEASNSLSDLAGPHLRRMWTEDTPPLWITPAGILDAGRNLFNRCACEQPFSDLVGDGNAKPSQLPFNFQVAYRLIAVAEDERILEHALVSRHRGKHYTHCTNSPTTAARTVEIAKSGVEIGDRGTPE